MIDIKNAKTAELIAFYNEHADRPVKKFSNRATAERRVQELIDSMEPEPEPEPEPAPNGVDPKRSAAQRAAWKRPEVKAARSRKQRVMVDGVEFRSVAQAFECFGLPMEKHIAFRGMLKKEKELNGFGHNWAIMEV